MRNLLRNKSTFYHARVAVGEPILEEPILDENGFETGEYRVLEVEAKPVRGHVAKGSGEAVTKIFGSVGEYDVPILLPSAIERKGLEFVEGDSLWLNIPYTPQTPPNYVIKRVTKSINHTWILCTKVLNG